MLKTSYRSTFINRGSWKDKGSCKHSFNRRIYFAEEYKNTSGGSESEIVIIDNGSQKEALLKKINVPEVSGIVIVCEGGDDPKICEKVYKAVSTALKIPSSRIYVAEMK